MIRFKKTLLVLFAFLIIIGGATLTKVTAQAALPTNVGPSEYILIGDSRGTIMWNAMRGSGEVFSTYQVGSKVGKTYYSTQTGGGIIWARVYGAPAMESRVKKGTAIIFWIGTNDAYRVDQGSYNEIISFLKQKAPGWEKKGAKVFFATIGTTRSNIKNFNKAQIMSMNSRIVSGLRGTNIKIIDAFGYTETLPHGNDYYYDAIHYTKSASKLIHDFLISEVNKAYVKDYEKVAGLIKNANIADGTYEIASALNTNMVLDIKGASTANGGNAQIYTANGTNAQRFNIKKVGDYYQIVNANSGKALDVEGGSYARSANVQQYTSNNTGAQRWHIVDAGGGAYYIINSSSLMALDVAGARAANGTNVWQYEINKSAAQKWILRPAKIAAPVKQPAKNNANKTAANTEKPVTVAGTSVIRSAVNTGYVLDVKGGAKSSGANVQLYKFNNTNAQKWKIEPVGGGMYKIVNVGSGCALDVKGAKAANATNIWQYKWNGTNAQKWIMKKNADGTVTFVSAVNQNYALDLRGAKTENGRNIHIYKINGTAAQRWYIS